MPPSIPFQNLYLTIKNNTVVRSFRACFPKEFRRFERRANREWKLLINLWTGRNFKPLTQPPLPMKHHACEKGAWLKESRVADMVSTRSLLSRGGQIFQNRVTTSIENLMLLLELCHIFAQEFHVIYVLENNGLMLFFRGFWRNKEKNMRVFTWVGVWSQPLKTFAISCLWYIII
jgi:hypothetical protein